MERPNWMTTATTTDQPWPPAPWGPGHWAINHIWLIIFEALSNFHAPFHVAPSVRYYEPYSVNCRVVFLCIALFPERRWCVPADFLGCRYRWKSHWVCISPRKRNFCNAVCGNDEGDSYCITSFPLDVVKSPRTTSEARISVTTVIQAAISLVVQQPQALLWTQRNSTKNEWCLQKLQWPHFQSVSSSGMNDVESDALHWCHTEKRDRLAKLSQCGTFWIFLLHISTFYVSLFSFLDLFL